MTESSKVPYYLALDPGGSTGWATFTEDGHGITMGTCKTREKVYDLLKDTNPSFIIIEDWITRKDVHLGGDRLEVVRVIGAVEFYAYIKRIPIVHQPNTIKPIGYKWAGLSKAGSKKDSHERDAYVHGVYFLQKRGLRKLQQGIRGDT